MLSYPPRISGGGVVTLPPRDTTHHHLRKLCEQHEQWVEGMGELMTNLDYTADKLESVAAELWGIDPPPSPSLDDDAPF